MIEVRSPSVAFREHQAVGKGKGPLPRFVTLPEECNSGSLEKIQRTVTLKRVERCHGVIRLYLYETMGVPWFLFY